MKRLRCCAKSGFFSRCSTCNLSTFNGCPGHCGHIELPVPVYHVSFMEQLLRLVRGTCVFCYHFRMPRDLVNQFVCKLKLIRAGLIREAEEMDECIDLSGGSTGANKGKPDDSVEDSNAELSNIISQRNAYVKKMLKQAGISRSASHKATEKTEAVSEARRLVIKDFYLEMTRQKKCRNKECNA
jgi:DNA-directed RNA polymerase beta' subunit